MHEPLASASELPVRRVEHDVHPLLPATFAPFGQVIAPTPSGREYGADDAQLEIGRGIPRFYILTLQWRPLVFRSITRHLDVTQCLASSGGRPWLVAVAPPNAPDDAEAAVEVDKIMAFQVPGNLGIKLHRGAWHASVRCAECEAPLAGPADDWKFPVKKMSRKPRTVKPVD